jgi:hypothetical protein
MTTRQLEELDKMEAEGNLWKQCKIKKEGQFCGMLQRFENVNICFNRDSCENQEFLSKEDFIKAVVKTL